MTLYVSSLIVGIHDDTGSKELQALIAKIKKLPKVTTVKVAVEYASELEHAVVSRIFDQSVALLGLSARPANVLVAEDILTVGELVQLSESDLLKLPRMGRGGLNEIKEALAEHNLQLKGTA